MVLVTGKAATVSGRSSWWDTSKTAKVENSMLSYTIITYAKNGKDSLIGNSISVNVMGRLLTQYQ